MPAGNMFATAELRFVVRHLRPGTASSDVNAVLTPATRDILQQRWVVTGTMWGAEFTDDNSEWRDVPLVTEVE